MATAPRRASPPVVTAEVCSAALPPQPQANRTAAASVSAKRILFGTARPFEHHVAFSEPSGKEPEAGCEIHESGRHPHDEAAELLIFKRSQAPGLCGGAVEWIPEVRGKGEKRAQDAGVHGGGEDIEDCGSI